MNVDHSTPLKGLDLFSGIGGISLALKDWVKTIAYCEKDPYAQSVLLSRMADGWLDHAPIWDDITTLKGRDLPANPDIIFGGFPCQDISVAGLGKGLDGERSGLVTEIFRLIDETKPTFVFLENVPAIRTRGLGVILKELAERGYDSRWTLLSAQDVGAPHRRQRWFLLGKRTHSNSEQWMSRRREREVRAEGEALTRVDGETQSLADANSDGLEIWESLRDDDGEKLSTSIGPGWWSTEPDVGGAFDGLLGELDGDLFGIESDEETQRRAKEILRDLQHRATSEAVQRSTRGLDCVQAQEVLFSIMREYEEGRRLPWRILESEETPEGLLREMRLNKRSPGPQLRPGSIQQYFREHPNLMRLMSRMVASRGKTPWSNALWESAIPRVTDQMSGRVDRLRCLGNSVVPLQAKTAFEILMGVKS